MGLAPYGFMPTEQALNSSLEYLKGLISDNENYYQSACEDLGKLAYMQLGDLTSKIPVIIKAVHLGVNEHECKFDVQLAIYGAAGWHTTILKEVSSNYIFIS